MARRVPERGATFVLEPVVLARPACRLAILSFSLLLAPAIAHAQTPRPDCANCSGPHVTVAPTGTEVANPLNTSPHTVTFTVYDDGNTDETFDFTCSSTGGIGCLATSPTSRGIAAGDSTTVQVSYSVGANVGTVKLTATGRSSGAFNTGWYTITANPTVTLVAPVLTSGSRAVVRTRQPLARALFATNGSPMDTTRTVLKWRSDTVTTLARANRGLLEWEPDSARWVNVGDSAQILVTACAQNGLCTTATRWAVLLNDTKPVLGLSGMPLAALGRQFTAPFGPGLSLSGA